MYNLRLRPSQLFALEVIAGTPVGVGVATNIVTGSAVGVLGNAGQGVGAISFVGEAVGEQKPTGIGVYRFFEEMAHGDGFVAVFGSASAQLKLNKAASGRVAVIGAGSAGIISAAGAGSGAAVVGAGDASNGLLFANGVGTLSLDGLIYGTGLARLLFSGQGAGLTARMGSASDRVPLSGYGTGSRGATGVGQVRLTFPTTSAGSAGVVGAGAAAIRCRGSATGARGASAVGACSLPIKISGRGEIARLVSGSGQVVIQIHALGEGGYERPEDYFDTLFIKTVPSSL